MPLLFVRCHHRPARSQLGGGCRRGLLRGGTRCAARCCLSVVWCRSLLSIWDLLTSRIVVPAFVVYRLCMREFAGVPVLFAIPIPRRSTGRRRCRGRWLLCVRLVEGEAMCWGWVAGLFVRGPGIPPISHCIKQNMSRGTLQRMPRLRITVGVTGFEPAASSSRTTRATKLRHTPVAHQSQRQDYTSGRPQAKSSPAVGCGQSATILPRTTGPGVMDSWE